MEKLLQDVQARLLDKVPALKYVDEDWGQLDYYGKDVPVKWPCGLIDATDAAWDNEGKLIQLGLVTVKIRLADMKLSNSSGAAPQGQKDKAFAIFGTLREIFKALHGWSGDEDYSKLIRTKSSRIKRNDGVRIYETLFTCKLKDASAMPVKATIKLA